MDRKEIGGLFAVESKRKKHILGILKDYVMIALGCLIYGIGLNSLLLPAQVPPGGFSGIATILNHVFGWKIGIVIFSLNIPLLLIAGFRSRFILVVRTIYTTILMSVFVDLFAGMPALAQNRLMSAVYGGLATGLGLGIILICGASSGGSDILAYAIQSKLKNISIAKILFTMDIAVIVIYAIVIGDVESTLYAGAAKFACSSIINLLTSGGERTKTVFIITQCPEKIARGVSHVLGRGSTQMQGQGMYTGKNVHILMVAVKRNEAFKLKQIVLRLDPSAFMILSDSSEIWGKGFIR